MENEQITVTDKKQLVKKIIFRCIGIILCALPAVMIEILALITFKDVSFEENKSFILVTHLCAVAAMLLAQFRPRIPKFLRLPPVLFAPFASFLMLEFLTHNPFKGTDGTPDMSDEVILLNILFFVIALFVLIFVTGHTAPAVITVTALPLILGLISYFTMEFRGTPLFPWDLASYGIAATVVGGYDLTLTPQILMIISCAVLTCTVAVVWNLRVKFPFRFIRPVLAVVMCGVMLYAGSYIQTDQAISDYRLYPYLFTPGHLYKTNGFTVSFLMNLRYATVDKPDGYNDDKAGDIAAAYSSDSANEAKSKPNIIVIMNESFADMTVLADFETTEECFPFIDSLEENTVKGNLHVSVVGGNTPNSEFEFLTGMTMGYLPSGSIPYQQFIKSERPSLATQLDSLGYHTVAMHPYPASGWKRNVVYPYFGFEETHFLDDPVGSFSGRHYIRGYVSDYGLYTKIQDLYEAQKTDEPLFVFAVTMQNHSGYSKIYENFFPLNDVISPYNDYPLSIYTSLMYESDLAFRKLVYYFMGVEEDTVILMFGDHQPNDSIAVPLMNHGGVVYDESDLKSSENRYIVPYVMWSNYEMPVSEVGDISLNYLSSVLIEAAGLPQTGSQKFLSSIRNKYPVITGRCIIDSTGEFTPVSEYDRFIELREYAYLQYNYLFDSDNLVKDYFDLTK